MTTATALQLPETITAPSRRIATKALHLPTRLEADGGITVASGSEPGAVYRVRIPNGADNDPDTWDCTCIGPGGCSHVWAALAACNPSVRRLLRKTAAAPVAVPSEAPAPAVAAEPTKDRAVFDALIAPTQSALRRHGGDGGFSVQLNGSDADVAAYFALCVMTNHPLRVTVERLAKTSFGGRTDH